MEKRLYLPDSELVLLLKQGNEIAFTEIYNRYWAEMYYHAFRMLKDEDQSKDIVQEVFITLWAKSTTINENIKLSGHLYISLRNKVLNLIAKDKVRNDYLTSIASFIDEATLSGTQLLEEKELLQLIENEIANLPPRMREIFELSRKQDLSHKQIAAQLNISEQTVKKTVQNALKILKPKLNAVNIGLSVLLLLR